MVSSILDDLLLPISSWGNNVEYTKEEIIKDATMEKVINIKFLKDLTMIHLWEIYEDPDEF